MHIQNGGFDPSVLMMILRKRFGNRKWFTAGYVELIFEQMDDFLQVQEERTKHSLLSAMVTFTTHCMYTLIKWHSYMHYFWQLHFIL